MSRILVNQENKILRKEARRGLSHIQELGALGQDQKEFACLWT